MTSPPAMVPRPVPGHRTDRVLDEVDAAVREQGVDSARMVAAG